jgi:hypothetical protein
VPVLLIPALALAPKLARPREQTSEVSYARPSV